MTLIITDWRVRDEDLPDVPPGVEFEYVSRPQKFIVLHRIVVRDVVLARLQVGAVDVLFELESEDGGQRTYKPRGLDDEDLKRLLVAAGAAVVTRDSIAVSPTLDIRALLRNEGDAPVKPRAALLVQEEEEEEQST